MLKTSLFSLLFILLITSSGFCTESSSGRSEMDTIEQTFDIGDDLFQLNIDVDAGEIEISRNNNSHECEVYVEYNSHKYEASVDFNMQKNRLKIEVEKDEWFANDTDHSGSCSPHNQNSCNKHVKIVLKLPYEPETDIRAKVKAGKLDFELGGISLSNFRLRSWAGETTVNFDTPNRSELRNFDVNCSIGEIKLKNLGNAHFRRANINSGIGELRVDFNGDPIDGAFAKIDLDIGETTITVPDHIGAKINVSRFLFFSNANCPCGFTKRGHTYYSENYDDADDILTIKVSAGIGVLDIKTRSSEKYTKK